MTVVDVILVVVLNVVLTFVPGSTLWAFQEHVQPSLRDIF